MRFVLPPPLRPGDQVAIVAPSGVLDRAAFAQGLTALGQRYQLSFTERIFDTHRYLAGDDQARLEELQRAFDEPSIRAVIAGRGGYGVMRLLPQLRFSSPKWLVGFSDLTALHLALQKHGWNSIHGPVVTQLGRQSPEVAAHLFALLEGEPVTPLAAARTVREGVVTGPLMGGNLSVLSRLIGTPWMPSFKGAILMLEDVGERPYRLDRIWTHLQLAGLFDGIAGLALGDFTDCEEKGANYTSAQVIDELAQSVGVPCAAGFPLGHGAVNQPVMLGATVRLDAGARTLETVRA